MKLFPDDTARAGPALAALRVAFHENDLRLWRARAKLFARVSHPSGLLDGESYDVDMRTATFTALSDGEPTAAGPLQVIATEYDGFWVWGWENPSLPGEAKSALGAALANDELFAGIRACMKFALDEESADSLAQLAAVRTGWLGAYPAPHGETIVHLALKLTPIANHSVEPADNIWCSFCGRLPQQVKNMVRAAEDCAVCSICIRTFCDILDESPPGESSDILGPCLLCGTRGSRVMGNFGAGCIACIRSVQDLAQ